MKNSTKHAFDFSIIALDFNDGFDFGNWLPNRLTFEVEYFGYDCSLLASRKLTDYLLSLRHNLVLVGRERERASDFEMGDFDYY